MAENNIIGYSSKANIYETITEDNSVKKEHELEECDKPFSNDNVKSSDNKDGLSGVQTGKYYELEKFTNSNYDVLHNPNALFYMIIVISLIVLLFRFIELSSTNCPITLYELFFGNCGK
jgi:hypothetical protein